MINIKIFELPYKIDGVLQMIDETNKSQRYITQLQHQDILALSNRQVINKFFSFLYVSSGLHIFLILIIRMTKWTASGWAKILKKENPVRISFLMLFILINLLIRLIFTWIEFEENDDYDEETKETATDLGSGITCYWWKLCNCYFFIRITNILMFLIVRHKWIIIWRKIDNRWW